MSSSNAIKQARMHIRIDASSKQKLERAAAYAHKSVAEFVLEPALRVAEEVISAQESLIMNRADLDIFLAALENPPAANTRLKKAVRTHQQLVRD
ncbi:MAG: hypothetical protein Tsb0027_22370 [Wenzhouxiangellaceae bacterium]